VKKAVANQQSVVGSEPTGGELVPAGRPLIAEEWRPMVEELLISGLAVEDIAEAVAAHGGPPLTAGAILAHFRTHPHLQKARIENTTAGAAKLRDALGNPEADEGLVQLANSALMIGYMGLTKNRSNSITIKDAECIRLMRENLKLKQQNLKLKEVGEKRENALRWRKARYEDIKFDTAVEKLKLLRKQFRLLMEEGKLDAGTLDKIREIYGIIRRPYLGDITEETPAQV
jgi:hypothetical protein